jgi:hypothetical protein
MPHHEDQGEAALGGADSTEGLRNGDTHRHRGQDRDERGPDEDYDCGEGASH